MQFVNIPMLAAWLCFHFSTDVTHLYAGLCLAGLSGGLLEVRSLPVCQLQMALGLIYVPARLLSSLHSRHLYSPT